MVENVYPHKTDSYIEKETGVEEKNNVIEQAREGRFNILTSYYERLGRYIEEKVPESIRNTTSTVANYTFVADFKFAAESIRGKTFGGRDLSALNRILYMTTAFLSFGGKALIAYGEATDSPEIRNIGAQGWAASWVPYGFVAGPDTWITVKALAEKFKLQSMVKLFNWVESLPKQVREKYDEVMKIYGPDEKQA